jgi:hypothetical protein
MRRHIFGVQVVFDEGIQGRCGGFEGRGAAHICLFCGNLIPTTHLLLVNRFLIYTRSDKRKEEGDFGVFYICGDKRAKKTWKEGKMFLKAAGLHTCIGLWKLLVSDSDSAMRCDDTSSNRESVLDICQERNEE